MALVRHWYPSPNKSSRSGTPRLLVIHTTEGFTGSNGMYDCAIYFQGPVGASSHVVIDNYHPGHICECVSSSYQSWTQCNYNGHTAASVEQCGYASWSRDIWLNEKMPLLTNVAAWLAEESARWDIPLTDLSSGSAQGSGTGVCYHSDLGSSGCGHSDPGSGYPLDVVLQMARGGSAGTSQEDDMIPGIAVWNNKEYYAWVDEGKICYRGPDTQDKPVVIDATAGAVAGCGMQISESGWTFVTFTNSSRDPYVLRRGPSGDPPWQRFRIADA